MMTKNNCNPKNALLATSMITHCLFLNILKSIKNEHLKKYFSCAVLYLKIYINFNNFLAKWHGMSDKQYLAGKAIGPVD